MAIGAYVRTWESILPIVPRKHLDIDRLFPLVYYANLGKPTTACSCIYSVDLHTRVVLILSSNLKQEGQCCFSKIVELYILIMVLFF